MAGPTFVRFVSAAPGRLVSRFDAPQGYIGARRASEEEVRATGERIVRIDGQVLPLTAEFCARFDKELRNAIRDGDLVERTEVEHQAWLALELERDAIAHPPAPAAAPPEQPAPVEQPVEVAPVTEPPPAEAPRSRK